MNTTITMTEQQVALAQLLNVEASEIKQSEWNTDTFIYEDQEYLVVTDEEAERLWDEDLENYIDDCVLSEMPERYQSYFDREAWKRDARIDGRAHSLNRYDGSEEEIEVDGTTYYIYRQN